jgi:CDP-diacylglycerol--serine O-phosphatidyltransferase
LKPPRARRSSASQDRRQAISLRQIAPNAVTAMALCFGLTGMRYAMSSEWERAVLAIVLAGVLDGLDGRIARLLHGESRFGAELDSLSDAVAFGVCPAVILYLWVLQDLPRFGWLGALALALCCALRLARYNANIDNIDQPMKLVGFNMGVPSPAGAGIALLPMFLWFTSGWDFVRDWRIVLPWTVLVAMLMISSLPTIGWKRLRVPVPLRIPAVGAAGMFAAFLLTAPWPALLVTGLGYVLLLPVGWFSYARIKRRRERTTANPA